MGHWFLVSLRERAVSLVTALVAVVDPLPVQPTDGLALVVPVVLGHHLVFVGA